MEKSNNTTTLVQNDRVTVSLSKKVNLGRFSRGRQYESEDLMLSVNQEAKGDLTAQINDIRAQLASIADEFEREIAEAFEGEE